VEHGWGENSNLTSDWNFVTCKKCLKQKNKIINWINETEKIIISKWEKG
jgi:hypothetical protein